MTLGWDNPTTDPTTTILLRHGDTRLSPEHRFSGLRDLPLSAVGTRQAKAAAGRLATGAPIDAVVSSPLRRAVATAAIAAGELGLAAVIDDDLRETDFGDWEGFTLAEIQQRWPTAAAAWRRDPERAPPGGESFADTAHRVDRACDRLLRDHGGQTVLVVSHITPIRSCCAGLSASRLAPFTGCISAPPALTRSSGTTTDLPPSIASTTPATFPDSPGPSRGRAEGAEELVAEGVHWLERSGVAGQQPVLPVPGSNLPENGRVVGDDRDRHLVAGPRAADRATGLLVAEQDEHEVRVVELGDP